MSDIKEYYQPLCDATEKYQKLGKEVEKVKRCISFLNDYINNNKKDEKLENKDLGTAFLETEEAKNKAFRSFVSKIIAYFLGVGMSYPVLISLGVTFSGGAIIIHIIIHMILLIVLNRETVPDFIRKRKAFRESRKCRKYLKKRKKENVNELLAMLYDKLNELRDEKRNLREYLSLADKQFLSENNRIANEILESHGIDAEISIETSGINLRESVTKKKRLK